MVAPNGAETTNHLNNLKSLSYALSPPHHVVTQPVRPHHPPLPGIIVARCAVLDQNNNVVILSQNQHGQVQGRYASNNAIVGDNVQLHDITKRQQFAVTNLGNGAQTFTPTGTAVAHGNGHGGGHGGVA